MSYLIESDMEMCEILNAYPTLSRSLDKLNFDVNKISDGESFSDYFKKYNLEDEEIELLVRKLNIDIKHILKSGELPESNIVPEKEVLIIGEEEE